MDILQEHNNLRLYRSRKYCTNDFYKTHRDESYPIKNDTRSRALIINMTKKRDGWKADVKALGRLFHTFDYHYELLIDPGKECLKYCLNAFAQHPCNKFVDSSMVVFMGHGGTDKDGKEFIKLDDGVYCNSLNEN